MPDTLPFVEVLLAELFKVARGERYTHLRVSPPFSPNAPIRPICALCSMGTNESLCWFLDKQEQPGDAVPAQSLALVHSSCVQNVVMAMRVVLHSGVMVSPQCGCHRIPGSRRRDGHSVHCGGFWHLRAEEPTPHATIDVAAAAACTELRAMAGELAQSPYLDLRLPNGAELPLRPAGSAKVVLISKVVSGRLEFYWHSIIQGSEAKTVWTADGDGLVKYGWSKPFTSPQAALADARRFLNHPVDQWLMVRAEWSRDGRLLEWTTTWERDPALDARTL